MPELQVDAATTSREGSPAHRVTVRGELDSSSTRQLDEVLDDLREQGARLVVLDTSEVEFVDSSGLRSIIAATNQLEEVGGRLVIDGMSPAMTKLLELTGLISRYRDGDAED